MKFAKILPADLVEVARIQHRLCAQRILMAFVVGPLSVPALGVTTAAAWLAVIVCCETWHWFATRSAHRGFMTAWEMHTYLLAGGLTVQSWTMLGILYWLSPAPGASAVAIALWAAQLIYTQRFVFQSVVTILIGNASTVFAMLMLPIIIPRFSPALQLPLTVAGLIGVAFAISGAMRTLGIITSLAREKAAVEHGATHDALTGLLNRTLMQRRLRETLAEGQPCAVFFLDLDRFKQVNDTMGHQSGDALLQEFARRLQDTAPPRAHIARFGGDEFAIVITASEGRDEVEMLCQQILQMVTEPFPVPRGQAHVGASIGVVFAPEEGSDSEELMRKADIALYAAKAGGRGQFRIFSPDMDGVVRDRTHLEDDLREVLATGNGLQLHYQPKIRADEKCTAVEALLRWAHPRLGDVAPARLLAVAEETGLIIPLSEWVLQEGMQFAGRWPDLVVAINISPAQLKDARFAAWVAALAARYKVEPSRIELEVTEKVFLEESAVVSQTLKALRDAGFRIALDDFGTGYSSLRHLRHFSVDRVKIDQSFLQHVGDSSEAAAIIQAVIQLAHAMGLEVTAEGVETLQHKEFLSRAGIDEMQGYFFSPACRESELGSFLANAGVMRRRAI